MHSAGVWRRHSKGRWWLRQSRDGRSWPCLLALLVVSCNGESPLEVHLMSGRCVSEGCVSSTSIHTGCVFRLGSVLCRGGHPPQVLLHDPWSIPQRSAGGATAGRPPTHVLNLTLIKTWHWDRAGAGALVWHFGPVLVLPGRVWSLFGTTLRY